MRACIQRVASASVMVETRVVGEIASGFVVLLGVGQDDTDEDVHYLADKVLHLRVFEDNDGKMNRSILETGGQMLVISQFTLFGDCRKGRRPSFIAAAEPGRANQLYEQFVQRVRQQGVHVEMGQFRAMMQVQLVNDGPVTLLLDSRKSF